MSPTATDERCWVERARAGDQSAFEALYRRYERPIYAFIYRVMGDGDDARDLAQECFVKAYRALPRTRPDTNFSAWLHRIAANACLDVLRRRQRLRWVPWNGPHHDHLVLGDPADDPERAAVGHETRAAVRRALERVSHRHRLGLILRECEGLNYAEIGQVMGLSRPAVKSLLHRARQEFRHRYAAEPAAGHVAGGGERR